MERRRPAEGRVEPLTLTFRSYSLIFSLYSCAASTFAGLARKCQRPSDFCPALCAPVGSTAIPPDPCPPLDVISTLSPSLPAIPHSTQQNRSHTHLLGFGSFSKLCTLVKIAATS